MMLIMGGNPAENHPCGFKWAMEAKRHRNAKIISVDPRFTRTSSTADLFVQIRAGTDIAFLGGLIRYAIENNRYAKEYLINYTNAAFIVRKDSSCRRTGCILDLTRRRGLTIRPPGIIRKAETSAGRRTRLGALGIRLPVRLVVHLLAREPGRLAGMGAADKRAEQAQRRRLGTRPRRKLVRRHRRPHCCLPTWRTT
jgi:anaerobic selenocysteine-containing dehydrogenase